MNIKRSSSVVGKGHDIDCDYEILINGRSGKWGLDSARRVRSRASISPNSLDDLAILKIHQDMSY